MRTLFLYLIFWCSLSLIWYNTASAEQAFWTHHCRTLLAVLQTIFPIGAVISSYVKWIPSHVPWQMQTTRSQMVPNPDSRKGVAKLQIWCYCCWSGSISKGSGVIMLKKHQFLSWWTQFILSMSLGSSCKSQSWFLYLWLCIPGERCLCCPRKWRACIFHRQVKSWIFYFWGQLGDNIQVTGFSFLGPGDEPNSHHL